jgi:hypothetical protein
MPHSNVTPQNYLEQRTRRVSGEGLKRMCFTNTAGLWYKNLIAKVVQDVCTEEKKTPQ